MAYENVQLTEANFVRVSGYFYHVTREADALFKITDDGTVAFSYPLDTDIPNTVESIQYDGYYFWTLENPAGYDLIIRKWEIDGFIAKQVRRYYLTGSSTKKYDSTAFAIESFRRNLVSTASATSNYIRINSLDRIEAGNIFRLGPSTFGGDEGKAEDLTVLTTSGSNYVYFTTNLQYSYDIGDRISFAKRCWFFNKFRPSDSDPVNGTGQLYAFNIHATGSVFVDPKKAGNEFRAVTAATYLKDTLDNREYLGYMYQTNFIFMETEDVDPDYLTAVKSATQNNQETDTTVIPVHEITIENETIFRLQSKGTFRDGATITTIDWNDEYNYQLATLARRPQSLSLTATPAIISAGTFSSSEIRAELHDQFDEPIGGTTVYFSDDDTGGASPGFVIPTSDITGSSGSPDYGVAYTTYSGGSVARTVKITANT